MSIDPEFELHVHEVMNYALRLMKMKGYVFIPMRRNGPVKKGAGYVEGHTSIGGRHIVIDVYTPRRRNPKKISAILAVLAHEIAHHQKPPYLQRYKGRIITRMHYPQFYKQVTKNIAKFKKDKELGKYYE